MAMQHRSHAPALQAYTYIAVVHLQISLLDMSTQHAAQPATANEFKDPALTCSLATLLVFPSGHLHLFVYGLP